jgi:hypothetical protein
MSAVARLLALPTYVALAGYCYTGLYYLSVQYLPTTVARALPTLPTLFPSLLRPDVDTFIFSIMCLVVFSALHSLQTLGVRRAALFAACVIVPVWTLEEHSLRTGFLFGEYTFNDARMGVESYGKLSHVPIITILMWYITTYAHLCVLAATEVVAAPAAATAAATAAARSESSGEGATHGLRSSTWRRRVVCVLVWMLSYSLITDGVHSSLGHAVWPHAATRTLAANDTSLPALLPFEPQPDWTFVSDPETDLFFRYCHNPIRNLRGWTVVTLAIFGSYFAITRDAPAALLHCGSGGAGVGASRLGVVIVGWLGGVIFYALHQSHPASVRIVATLQSLLLVDLLGKLWMHSLKKEKNKIS